MSIRKLEKPRRALTAAAGAALVAWSFVGCTPTVQMAAPEKPITVNLNVKIQHEIYVKVDKDLDAMFSEKDLF